MSAIDTILSALSPPERAECRRLFHGRGHAWPGLEHVNIDWLPPVVLITLYREEEADWLQALTLGLLPHLPECRSVQVQYRSRPRAPYELLWGEAMESLQVVEGRLHFALHLGGAQNSGLFLDMRHGRDWVRQHARGRRVLNLFAYTCGFSVAALAGGASEVVNFDVSKAALRRGRENHQLNGHDLRSVRFEGLDIFRSFSRIKRYAPYDLLICDPPSLQKGSVDIERDYAKVIRRIPEFMQPGGQLLLCLNAPWLGEEYLPQLVAAECPDCRLLQRLPNPPEFREADPERGLKVMLFEYLPT